MATQSRYNVRVSHLLLKEDLPELPKQLRDDFLFYQQQLVRNPQNPPRIPSHRLDGTLKNHRVLEIEWAGIEYRLVYRIHDQPAPRWVEILSFAEHDLAYARANTRLERGKSQRK